MWDFLRPRNLIDFQRLAALERLDRGIAEDFAAGYEADVDRGLEERLVLMGLLRGGPVA